MKSFLCSFSVLAILSGCNGSSGTETPSTVKSLDGSENSWNPSVSIEQAHRFAGNFAVDQESCKDFPNMTRAEILITDGRTDNSNIDKLELCYYPGLSSEEKRVCFGGDLTGTHMSSRMGIPKKWNPLGERVLNGRSTAVLENNNSLYLRDIRELAQDFFHPYPILDFDEVSLSFTVGENSSMAFKYFYKETQNSPAVNKICRLIRVD